MIGALVEAWRDYVRARCVRRDHELVRVHRVTYYEYPSKFPDWPTKGIADEVTYETRSCRCGVVCNEREVHRETFQGLVLPSEK